MQAAAAERRVVLVTGAARGIGAATVARFLQSGGYHVVGADVLEVDPGSLGADGGTGDLDVVRCDVSDESQVANLIAGVVERWGRIDALLNVAGVVLVKPLTETTWGEFQRLVGVNLGGPGSPASMPCPTCRRDVVARS